MKKKIDQNKRDLNFNDGYNNTYNTKLHCFAIAKLPQLLTTKLEAFLLLLHSSKYHCCSIFITCRHCQYLNEKIMSLLKIHRHSPSSVNVLDHKI